MNMASPDLIHSYYVHSAIYPDGPLRLPRRIATDRLEAIPEAYRAAYDYIEEDDPGRGYELSTAIADVIRDGEAELASLKAQFEKLQVEGPVKLAAVKQQMRDDAINTTVQLSLAKAGAHEGLVEGAMSILKKRNEFEAEKSDEGTYAVLARTSLGLAPVDGVVQQFMQSEEGAAYRGKPARPAAGSHFNRLSERLKLRH
ncbi:hypothetical protein NKH93_06715 [Mesorhizobium sp. M0954]|uniref:hypothetical protein n=1 Tax=Mesorhizobium sp. M0954 TaxID=2957032 RepID=UPI00333AF256